MLKVHKAVKAYNERGMLLERTNKYVFIGSDYELIDLKPDEVRTWLKQTISFVNDLKQRLKK
jgi:hypothetical protein